MAIFVNPDDGALYPYAGAIRTGTDCACCGTEPPEPDPCEFADPTQVVTLTPGVTHTTNILQGLYAPMCLRFAIKDYHGATNLTGKKLIISWGDKYYFLFPGTPAGGAVPRFYSSSGIDLTESGLWSDGSVATYIGPTILPVNQLCQLGMTYETGLGWSLLGWVPLSKPPGDPQWRLDRKTSLHLPGAPRYFSFWTDANLTIQYDFGVPYENNPASLYGGFGVCPRIKSQPCPNVALTTMPVSEDFSGLTLPSYWQVSPGCASGSSGFPVPPCPGSWYLSGSVFGGFYVPGGTIWTSAYTGQPSGSGGTITISMQSGTCNSFNASVLRTGAVDVLRETIPFVGIGPRYYIETGSGWGGPVTTNWGDNDLIEVTFQRRLFSLLPSRTEVRINGSIPTFDVDAGANAGKPVVYDLSDPAAVQHDIAPYGCGFTLRVEGEFSFVTNANMTYGA